MMRATLIISIILWVSLVVVTADVDEAPPAVPTGLIPDYYKATNQCPNVEQIVRRVTWANARDDPALGAKLLRLHFHDCFVRGCDASILLDTVGTNQSEKEARPNLSLGRYEVIDEIKTEVEKFCPGVVSCADILALAARDAVSFQYKRSLWDVLTGRKDGRISRASDITGNLPGPSSNFALLVSIFANKGLDINDLVALSGAHTIGIAHCAAFARRLNFTGAGDTDATLDPTYAAFLRTQCPSPANPNTEVEMDPNSSLSFDSNYYTTVNQSKGLFQSDAALLTNPTSASIVQQFQDDQDAFFQQFNISMVKMGGIEVLLGSAGEVRANCRVVNS